MNLDASQLAEKKTYGTLEPPRKKARKETPKDTPKNQLAAVEEPQNDDQPMTTTSCLHPTNPEYSKNDNEPMDLPSQAEENDRTAPPSILHFQHSTALFQHFRAHIALTALTGSHSLHRDQ